MARLAVHLLGPLQAILGLEGEPVKGFESDKVRALLAYLAIEGARPHRREKLAGLLWPMLPESSARANLRVALANLRKTTGDQAAGQLLLVTRQTIQLHPQGDLWVDVADFLRLVQADGRPRQVVRQLEEALALYRGPFLEGFALGDSPAFEEWAILEREHLQRRAVAALDRLVSWYEQQGEFDRALHHARRQLQLEPWQEQGQRQLMRLLALSGQRNAALAQYEALCHLLAEELSVEPEDETSALYRRIRDGQTLYGLAEAPPPNNLPAPLTPFVGREEELDQVYRRLHDPGCRLVTVVGPGGSGKTRLAREVAREVVSAAPWGRPGPDAGAARAVFFLSLASLPTAEAIVPALAEALGFTPDEARAPRQQLLDYLRHKEMLLVLDNLEHLPGAAELVTELLRAAPGIKILATSRVKLNLRAETLFPLGGMDLPGDDPLPGPGLLQHLGRYDGLRLFVEAAGRVQPGFALRDDNAADVLQICRLVGGLPLGILLAAAWVETMPPSSIAAEIQKGLDFLASGWQDAPHRQRSMRAVFDHSWRLLGLREQQVLRGLSVFRGNITVTAAREVVGTDAGELEGLANKSLLGRVAVDRFEMHELLRQYAAEKLEDSPQDCQAAQEAHSAYFARALAKWADALKGEGQQTALAELERDAENARAAWLWAAQHCQVARLGQALEGLCIFYELRIRYQQGMDACRLAAEQIAGLMPSSAEAIYLQARLLAWQSVFVRRPEGVDVARQLLEHSLALLDDARLVGRDARLAGLDTRPARAFTLWRWGRLVDSFDRQTAKTLYEQSLELYRAAGDRWGEANALSTLGSIAWNLGNLDEARRWHQESLVLRQELGDRRGIANALMAVGTTALSQGRLTESEEMVRRGCAMRREIGDRRGMADGIRHLGVACISLGRFAEAASLLEESVSIYDNLGFRFGLEVAMLGDARVHLGDYQAGWDCASRGLAVARGTGFRRGIGYGLFVLGEVALAREAYEDAGRLLQESIAAYREIGQGDELCRSLAGLGYAAWGRRQPQAAWDHIREALAQGSEQGVSFPLWFCLPATALLLIRAGEVERAVALYALAARAPAIARSRWFEDVAGRRVATAAAKLPAEVVAAARARGQEQELSEAVAKLLAQPPQPLR